MPEIIKGIKKSRGKDGRREKDRRGINRRGIKRDRRRRDRILEIDKELDNLRAEKKGLLIKLQKECKHETIIETPCQSHPFGISADAPRKICVICGLEEEGWGCGYKKLNKEPIMIVENRDEFYRLRELQSLTTKRIPASLVE